MTPPSSLRVLLAPSADLARATLLTEDVRLTVEAEYGAYVAPGSLYTAAHHQPLGSPYAGTHVGGERPSPCNDRAIPSLTEGVILVSHLDLDTVGGCLRAMPGFADLFPQALPPAEPGAMPDVEGSIDATLRIDFWGLAEFIDVRGAHKRGLAREHGFPTSALNQLDAWWAWHKVNTPRFPRDTGTEVTAWMEAAGAVLRRILAGEPGMLLAGVAFRGQEDALNRRTFIEVQGEVLVRTMDSARDFCNHLYATPDGLLCRAVASLNTGTGAVTISLADPVDGVSCRTLVQGLWGPEAGGHDGIAGSPRERTMNREDLQAAVQALDAALQSA